MNSQLFFLLNLILAIVFLVWFLSGKKEGAGRPTRLLTKKEAPVQPKLLPPAADDLFSQGKNVTPTDSRPSPPPKTSKVIELPSASFPGKPKTLNVLFLYNGHDWDAYEVLGVPAGASLSTVTTRYQQLIRDADRGKMEFFEAAYQAILKKA